MAFNMARAVFRLADNRDIESFSSRLRFARFRKFIQMLPATGGPVRILDVGGTTDIWQRHYDQLPSGFHVTLLNLEFVDQPPLPYISYVVGDARDMRMFSDFQFDICFSNSVIEHAMTRDDQRAIAKEIRRVANGYFVQTPNRYFPMEPHFLVPGWQFLPVWLRVSLLQQRDLGWMKRVSDRARAREAIESIRLLNERELRGLFFDGHIHREQIGPLTKSLIAWRQIHAAPSVARHRYYIW